MTAYTIGKASALFFETLTLLIMLKFGLGSIEYFLPFVLVIGPIFYI